VVKVGSLGERKGEQEGEEGDAMRKRGRELGCEQQRRGSRLWGYG
jgi:hypothetical protein